eukprot:UN19114
MCLQNASRDFTLRSSYPDD